MMHHCLSLGKKLTLSALVVFVTACGDIKPAAGPIDKTATTEVSRDAGGDELPSLSVELLGPVSSLKGHTWPLGRDWEQKQDNVPLGMATEQQPHHLLVRLPGGRTLRISSKGTIFGQHNNIVEDAELLPHPGELEFQEAIKLLALILKDWNAEPDERSKKLVDQWKAEGDMKPYELAEYRGRAVLQGEDRVDLTFQIRAGKTGWLLWITVGATMEERRKILGLPAVIEPATKPTRDQEL